MIIAGDHYWMLFYGSTCTSFFFFLFLNTWFWNLFNVFKLAISAISFHVCVRPTFLVGFIGSCWVAWEVTELIRGGPDSNLLAQTFSNHNHAQTINRLTFFSTIIFQLSPDITWVGINGLCALPFVWLLQLLFSVWYTW